MEELLQTAVQFGSAGLLFVVWLREKNDSLKNKQQTDDLIQSLISSNKREDQLVQVVKENTIAITTLTERLKQ